MAQMIAQVHPRAVAEKQAVAETASGKQAGLYCPDGALSIAIFAGLATYLAAGFMSILFVGAYLIHKGAP